MNSSISAVRQLTERFEVQTGLHFRPGEAFFLMVGIKPDRFHRLLTGKSKPGTDEIRMLTGYFSRFFPVSAEELLSPGTLH